MMAEFIGGIMDGKQCEVADGINAVTFPSWSPHLQLCRFDNKFREFCYRENRYVRRDDGKYQFTSTVCEGRVHEKSLNKDGRLYWIAEAESFLYQLCDKCDELVPVGTASA